MELYLVQPTEKLKMPFIRMLQAYRTTGEPIYCDEYNDPHFDFQKYIYKQNRHSKGLDLPIGFVPYTTFWLTDENEQEIYDTSRLRHMLCDFLLTEGGHIGYDVNPLYRRKRYGTLLCSLTLREAKKIGINKALLVCESDNIGSKKIIEENGGILQDEIVSPSTGRIHLRYWIIIE